MSNLATSIRLLTCAILIAGLLAIPAAAQNGLRPLPPGGFYMADVSNPDHSPVIVAAQSHLIYVNNPPSYFGAPATFLTDLGNSEYIHLVDQYVGSSSNYRYTVGQSFNTNYPIPVDHFLTMADVFNIVHAAAQTAGSGYGHIYHVLLPKGINI